MLAPTRLAPRAKALRAVRLRIALSVPKQMKTGETAIGAILLMIAFIISAAILAFGAAVLNLDVLRVRMGISLGFFLFCFLAVVLYYNLSKRVKQAPQMK